ncbi:PREDICTED: nitric oxide-associated protein 1 [Ceratosolen solmsi marchali]|uniref:Nitric oxide-associated protein 1 n=1 Tax=Ceratosolen solmsi marchali TaxID=326594 RepID=A0AAJ6VKA1_9HYME|nr:PREDICTED: nitric oxide-associated protein 1 [Ceratosolen solmsi marchali]
MQHCYLKLSRIKNVYKLCIRNYYVIDEMVKLKTTDLDDLLDLKVRKLKDKLLYSDYIESKRLKLGYKKNIEIKVKLKQKFEYEKRELNLNNKPLSIALKYLDNDQEKIYVQSENCSLDEKDELEQDAKPINMPYAAIDKYKKVPQYEKFNHISNDVMPEINEKYRILYEKYLEYSKSSEVINNEIMDSKFRIRLEDDFSKVSKNWMTDYEFYDDILEEDLGDVIYGTPDVDTEVSSIPCGGCGSLLHCKDVALPGYLPSELFLNKSNSDLQSIICQRCHFMKYYDTCLDVRVSADEYPKLLEQINDNPKAWILLLIDLTDFPCSIWPHLPLLLGKKRSVIIVGNKVDLLPTDSPYFLENVTDCLTESLIKTGVNKINIKHIALISAKSGYGVENLINKLHSLWKYKSDVYLIGCTNSGKSTLFNTLLQSDFCKSQAVDIVQRATTSQWPGTTLNMLKFPILKPASWRLYLRLKRLQNEKKYNHAEAYLRNQEFRRTKNIELATLQNRINHTFKRNYDFGKALENEPDGDIIYLNNKNKIGLDETSKDYQFSRWCYDTPGVNQPDQILQFLTTNELFNTLPNRIISPKTFCIWPEETIFIGGLGRLDILSVPGFIRCTIFASNNLPITICKVKDAELVYNELLQTEAFVVPDSNPNRLKMWPELKSKDFKTIGIGESTSASDVVLSNAGWIAITANTDYEVNMRAWTPEGRGIYLRNPPLLSKSVTLRGMRISGSRAYKRGKQVHYFQKF